MTRRKKLIYGAGIALALLGVLVDRLTSGATSGVATVEAAGAVSVVAMSDVVQTEESPRVSIRPADFPAPVADVGMLDGLERDPFEITEAALAYLQPASADGEALGDRGDGRSGRREFEESHRLEAVLHLAGRRVAVIDGVLVRAGQSLDGCRLEQIQIRNAIFVCADGETELFLDNLLPGVSAAAGGLLLPQAQTRPGTGVDGG